MHADTPAPRRKRKSDRPVWLGRDARGWDHARIHRSLITDPNVGAYELAVYVGLAIHAETRSGDARPAAATLAAYAGCSERRARTALSRLAEAGWIEVLHRPGEASIYRLLPPPTPAPDADLTDLTSERGAAHPGTTFRGTPAPDADEREPVNESQERQAPAELPLGGLQSSPTTQKAPDTMDAGRLIASAVWEARKAAGQPVPAQPFIAVAKIARSLLVAGHDHERIVAAMTEAPTITTAAVELALSRRSGRRRRGAIDRDRDGPSGRITGAL